MVTCDSCRIALVSEHFQLEGVFYCCAGCAAGGPCVCTYEHDPRRYPPPHYALPVSLNELLDRYELRLQQGPPRMVADIPRDDHQDSA